MKKKIIGLVSVFLVLAVSLAVYFAFGNEPVSTATSSASSTPAPTAEPKTQIIDVDLADAKYITIKNPDEDEYKLEHTQKIEGEDTVDVYKLNTGVAANEDDIGTIFSLLTSLSGTQVAESVVSGAADSDFGFDKMTLVTLEMNDGSKHIFEVGDYVNGKDGTFIRKQGETKVYVIGQGEGMFLKSNINQLKNLNLFLATEDDFVDKISMTQKGTFKYTIEGTEIKREDLEDTEDWFVTAPIKQELIYDSSFQEYMNQFYNIQASSCIEEATDLKQYGLDNPAYEIEFTVNSKNIYKLLLGNKDEDGAYYYAMWNDSNNVYTLPVSQFYDIDKSLEDMVRNIVSFTAYYELSEFEIDYNGENHVFGIETEKNESGGNNREKDTFTYKGKIFTQTVYPEVCESFRKIYESFMALWSEEFEPEATPELKDPVITFKLHVKATKKTQVIQYVEKNSDRLYVFVDNEYTGMLAKSSTINNAADYKLPGLANTLPAFKELFKTVK